jgi:hypothetical protein
MSGCGGVDYIDFDSQLNDEERLMRQTAAARRFPGPAVFAEQKPWAIRILLVSWLLSG